MYGKNCVEKGLKMQDQSPGMKIDFYRFLESVESLESKQQLNQFFLVHGLSFEYFMDYVKILDELGIDLQYDQDFIYPLKNGHQIKIELSISEWYAIESLLRLKEVPRYKLHEIESKITQLTLSRSRKIIGESLELPQKILHTIERAIAGKNILELTLNSQHTCYLVGHRLTYIDNELCVIGEEVKEHTLLYFSLADVVKVKLAEASHDCQLTQLEINDFINHVRLIGENEERLVLKVFSSHVHIDLSPRYHYLSNPFVTNNPEGDFIWAATIEINEALFEWLYSIKDHIEILDPSKIRKDFYRYCEQQKEKSLLKKIG